MAKQITRSIHEIGQEVKIQIKDPNRKGGGMSLDEYCKDFNRRKAGATIDKSFMSRLTRGRGPKHITDKVRQVCKDLEVPVHVDLGDEYELLPIIKKIPSSKYRHIKSILNELAVITQEDKK